MKRNFLLTLIICITVACTFVISPSVIINAAAPDGWRDLPDFYAFKDKISGWSGSGADELETENGNLPIDTEETYEDLPSLRFNLQTELTSGWMSSIICLAEWACHDVSRYVPNGYLEFNVKGAVGGEEFIIGAVDHVSERESGVEHTITKPVADYCTVSTEWQHVKIPLKEILDPSLDMDPYNAKAIVLDRVTNDPFCVWINQLKLTSPDKEEAFPAIKVNQVGFSEHSEKYAYVSGFEDDFNAVVGTPFQVKNVSDNTVEYSGELVLVKEYDANDSGEKVLKAVFTEFEKPGDYYITVSADGIEESPKFKIGNDVFEPLLTDVSRYLYYQRASIDLTEEYCPDYPREDKTPLDATAVIESNNSITRDVTKGWFDAGDLGKYVSTGAMTAVNLLWSYELFPEVYKDNQFNIPESENDIPDILDEIKWELDWILKMQDVESGGFYAQVQSDDDGNITQRIIKDTVDGITDVKPTDPAACAAAALAQASIIFEKIDPVYSQKCLNAAKSAWTYLEQNPENIKAMPPYGTDDDSSSRFLASASLYRATGEEKYNDYFTANYANGKSAYENSTGDWVGSWNFAFFAYMKSENRSSEAEEWFKDEFSIWVNNKIDRYKDSAWGNIIANGNYYWGSNSQILGVCMEAVIGSRVLNLNDSDIDNMSLSSLNWILGANPMRKSFVSGYGDDCIKTIFSSFNNDGKAGIPKGFMPGGPNRYQGVGLSIFPAKCYLDSADEWATNEHTTGWNSILAFVTSFANFKSNSQPTQTPTSSPTTEPTPTSTSTIDPATATPTKIPTSTPDTSENYKIDYKIVNDWGSGATINIAINNTSNVSISNWKLSWTFPGDQQITNIWGGIATQDGQSVLVTASSWNSIIPPNGSVDFGFNITYSGSNKVPSDFTLN